MTCIDFEAMEKLTFILKFETKKNTFIPTSGTYWYQDTMLQNIFEHFLFFFVQTESLSNFGVMASNFLHAKIFFNKIHLK